MGAVPADMLAQAGIAVAPLEWDTFWDQTKGHREFAITSFGATYHVSADGWWHPMDRLHKCDGMEAAKAAAQGDYEARLIAALTGGAS